MTKYPALKYGLNQLNAEQLQRVLDTPEKKLLFNGELMNIGIGGSAYHTY